MFEFLGGAEAEIIHLIHDFMHKWFQADETQELWRKRRGREHDEAQKRARARNAEAAAEDRQIDDKRRDELRKSYREDQKLEVQGRGGAVEKLPPTMADIVKGVGRSHDEIKVAMSKAEVLFIHVPHENSDMTRYALREHAEHLSLHDWRPGLGF